MERSTTSWLRTLGIQLSLCFALYIVLNLGQPQKLVYNDNGSPFDLYFISVRGGFRSLQEQTHLLKLDTVVVESPSGKRGNLSNWLTRTLKATTSDWRMVVGFHPLVACKENEEEFTAKLINEPLHHIFVKFGVNVYLSQQGCCSYALQDNVAYIGNPGLIKENSRLGSGNGRYRIGTEMTNGFLLHRLGSLEMVTYFVTSAGEIVKKIVVQQRGRQVM
ncbi:hypothetical protein ERO13_A07G026200v2 [Gossypium hirsutum]|nr:hypothetical protein ERO13_A07G026200v2 [Gossypium hirsutum]KAG4190367.1 hypothetical protein ERO13_A07G026200v2 [Gossypium hirsutum]